MEILENPHKINGQNRDGFLSNARSNSTNRLLVVVFWKYVHKNRPRKNERTFIWEVVYDISDERIYIHTHVFHKIHTGT